jgi:hypothetical protein
VERDFIERQVDHQASRLGDEFRIRGSATEQPETAKYDGQPTSPAPSPAPAIVQRKEAIKRRAAGETLAEIAKSYAVDISMISRLS